MLDLNLKDGASFGEVGFFTRIKRLASVRSLDFIYVYRISSKIFLSITEKERLKEDKEVYFEIKDGIELNHDYRCLDITCYSCGKSDHLISECPYIHYVMKPEELLGRINKKLGYFRKSFKRYEKRKVFFSRANLVLIQSSAIALMNALKIMKHEENKMDSYSEGELEENIEGVGNSYLNITRYKEEKDFDKIIKFKSKSEEISPLFRILCESKIGGMSPAGNKSRFSKRPSKKIINFAEAALSFDSQESLEGEEGKREKPKIAELASNKNIYGYGESFQIDKIEFFTKYFPNYNFDKVAQKINPKNVIKNDNKSRLLTKKQEMSAKIELMKKKTIRHKINLTTHKDTMDPLNEESLINQHEESSDFQLAQHLTPEINLNVRNENSKNLVDSSINDSEYDKVLSNLEIEKVEEWIRQKKKLF